MKGKKAKAVKRKGLHPKPQAKARMGMAQKFFSLSKDPDRFFSSVAGEKGILPAFSYYALLGIAGIVIMWPRTARDPSFAELSAIAGPALLPAVFIGALASIFAMAFINHIFVRLLGGKGGYYQTFKAAAYGGATAGLIGAVPAALIVLPVTIGLAQPPLSSALDALSTAVSFAFSFWAIYLISRGIARLHGMTFGRAVVATFLLPFVVVMAAVFAAVFASILLVSVFSPELLAGLS